MNVVINYTIHELTQYTRGKLHQYFPKIAEPTNLALDSRKILSPEDTVFFAMHSSHRNGYEFAKFVYEKGVRNFVIEKKSFEEGKLAGANVILVENSLTALQYLAIHHREDFMYLPSKLRLPLIGITGSNGKTIVKEWLNYILQNKYSVVRSPGSYNSQVGVPLSVLNLNSSHNLAIFEAGISSPGEMILLEKMIRPTIGIFTNIGLAHAAGFKNTIQKIQEKLKLFSRSSYLIYCSDDVVLDEEVRQFYKETVTYSTQFSLCNWGKSAGNFLQISSLRKTKGMTAITAIFKGRKMAVTIPFIDDASVENAIHCWCTSLLLDVDTEETIQKFSTLYPIAMRLEIKEGNNHCTIINDSYSNDLHSLGIGLNFLAQQKQHNSRSIVLSDILQSGLKPQKLYADVSNLLQQGKVDKLIAIGPEIYKCQKEFSSIPSSLFFLSTDDFLKHSSPTIFQNESILVKGARSFGFEEIVSFLEKKVHKTVLSINLNALVHNLKEYKKLLHPNTKIMAMVKAFSYGSGSFEIASVLEFHKVDYLAVAYADEAVELRRGGINLPIMVMNVEESTFDLLIQYNLEPEIFSFTILEAYERYLESNGLSNVPAHIKIDTGMHRLGFTPDDMPGLVNHFQLKTHLKIMSVFTHLVASEDSKHDEYSEIQVSLFEDCTHQLEKVLGYSLYKHTANTSAISRHSQRGANMVRLGIGLYGIDSNRKMQENLQNVTTLATTISQIKNVKAGESVGYGRNALLAKDSIVATVRIGYADGYPRTLGNGMGKMLIKGRQVSVIGNVCMDMTMLDITGIDGINEGDSVEVFGENLPITDLAFWAGTIPYEIMTGISQRVKRVYFEE